MSKTTTIEVPILARVEGEGALDLEITNDRITKCQVRIYEPPRYFEKFLEGREANDILDASARICGICPLAYQISLVYAMERIYGVEITPEIHALRKFMYLGEWVESHYLHTHILAAPDFLKYNSAIEMAKDFPNEVKRGVKLQQLGNDMMSILGGRPVNPGGIKVGGFYRTPLEEEMQSFIPRLKEAIIDAKDIVMWFSTLPFPQIEDDVLMLSLYNGSEYPLMGDRIISNKGLNISIQDWETFAHEFQEPHSTSLHNRTLQNEAFFTGPLARINLNFQFLPKELQDLAHKTGIKFPSNNIFHSIVARAIEGVWALMEALKICEEYTYITKPSLEYKVKAGSTWGASEAPRGIQIDKISFKDDGRADFIRLTPPTSLNLAHMEKDLVYSLEKFGLNKTDQELQNHAEMVIRNYDPCISCSAHFLTLNVTRK